MYIIEDLPVNNTRRFFKNRPDLLHRSQPIKERRRRRAPPPRKRGGTHGTVVGFKDDREHLPFISTLQISLRHIISFSNFFFFFTPILLRQRFSTSTEAHAWSFFLIYIYIRIFWSAMVHFHSLCYNITQEKREEGGKRRSCRNPVYKHCWCP